jgi:hypothetical protein
MRRPAGRNGGPATSNGGPAIRNGGTRTRERTHYASVRSRPAAGHIVGPHLSHIAHEGVPFGTAVGEVMRREMGSGALPRR